VADDDAPKTAYELILERLKKKDQEEGIVERPLTDDQRAQIAQIRQTYEARVAESEILHQSARRKATTPEELERLEEEYRRDRDRAASDRDRRIDEVRRGGS